MKKIIVSFSLALLCSSYIQAASGEQSACQDRNMQCEKEATELCNNTKDSESIAELNSAKATILRLSNNVSNWKVKKRIQNKGQLLGAQINKLLKRPETASGSIVLAALKSAPAVHTVCKQKAKKEAEARLIAEALLTLTGAAPVSTFPAQKTFIPMSEDELKLAASTK